MFRFPNALLSTLIVTCLSASTLWGQGGPQGNEPMEGAALLVDPEQVQQQIKPEPTRPVRLVSEAREAQLRELLPQVSDKQYRKLLHDPDLMFYTDREMPPAYQLWGSSLQGVHAPDYNISAGDGEPFGNGNREFPWSTPAGTHRTSGVTTFRFMYLPKDKEGHPLPIVWHRRGDGAYAWTFPVGTVFGEVLGLTAPDGESYTFEVRVRKREKGDWLADAFRPYPTAKDLARRIKQLRPDWKQNEQLAAVCEHLLEPLELEVLTLADSQPTRRTFKSRMAVDELPELGDDKLVAELLSDVTFHSCLGRSWRINEAGSSAAAPTTQASFHIVPKNYDAGFIDVDQLSCMRCHNTTNKNVKHFDAAREWYGNIRGSDAIFSFHPFAPSCISHNGFSQPVQFRAAFTDAGILVKYDQEVHSNELYHSLELD